MTMEVVSNSRDGLLSSTTANVSLQLSVEQWELLRRLRNSHLTRLQIIRAYDELDRLDRELGTLFNSASHHPSPPFCSSLPSSSSSTHIPSAESVSPTNNRSSPSSASITSNNTNKRSHSHIVNGHPSIRLANGYQPLQLHHSTSSSSCTSSNVTVRVMRSSANESNTTGYALHEPMTQIDFEEEARELQDLLAKGDIAVHNEISVFVYRYDLKQSQIARMAAVNQAYVSKFLRGDIFDLSENGRMAICRWYLRYKRIVQCMGGAQPSVELLVNLTNSCEPSTKVPRLVDPQSTNNTSPVAFDAPKRTRFTFRPEHLDILEKAFLDNPYPDPRRREDIARHCNEARTRIEGTNELLSERDRVTDAIVTHWFQNKRKMTKSQRGSVQEDSISLMMSDHNPNYPSNGPTNDVENTGVDDSVHLHHHHHHRNPHERKSSVSAGDIDSFRGSPSTLDPQMAAYRAIMSRMVPFASHVNGHGSSRRFIKQEPMSTPIEPSDDDDSDDSRSLSPVHDHLPS